MELRYTTFHTNITHFSRSIVLTAILLYIHRSINTIRYAKDGSPAPADPWLFHPHLHSIARTKPRPDPLPGPDRRGFQNQKFPVPKRRNYPGRAKPALHNTRPAGK